VAIVQPIIETHRAELAAICRRFHVSKLDLFGAASRDDVDPERGDFDFLVALDLATSTNACEDYVRFKDALESLFGRTVALVMEGTAETTALKRSIASGKQPIFPADA
jgi:predicted nucleotidyltransferase